VQPEIDEAFAAQERLKMILLKNPLFTKIRDEENH